MRYGAGSEFCMPMKRRVDVGKVGFAAVVICVSCTTAERRGEIDPAERPANDTYAAQLVAQGAMLARSVTATRVTRRLADTRSRAVLRWRPPSVRSTQRTSRPMRKRVLVAGLEQAFLRSLREGVDRDGQHLYPAFCMTISRLSRMTIAARCMRTHDPRADSRGKSS